MIALALKLLLAHFLGDFALQPISWVKHKKEFLHQSKYLYLHILIHAVLLLMVLEFKTYYIPTVLSISILHLAIDWLKLKLTRPNNEKALFVIDQLLHLLVIGLAVYINIPFSIPLTAIFAPKFVLAALGIILSTVVAAVIMRLVMSTWSLEDYQKDNSLAKAGKYIGILERLFVFSFIVLNQWGAIGFLITAKSVFRFGDLSQAKNRQLTEYVLIGTLLSFGMAIGVGLLYVEVLKML